MTVKGPAIPFQINPDTGSVAWSADREKLTTNIRMILTTRTGARPMNRDFGAGLHDLVHEQNDGGLARLIARRAQESLMQQEPRVVVTDMQFSTGVGEFVMEITYGLSNRPHTELLRIPLR